MALPDPAVGGFADHPLGWGSSPGRVGTASVGSGGAPPRLAWRTMTALPVPGVGTSAIESGESYAILNSGKGLSVKRWSATSRGWRRPTSDCCQPRPRTTACGSKRPAWTMCFCDVPSHLMRTARSLPWLRGLCDTRFRALSTPHFPRDHGADRGFLGRHGRPARPRGEPPRRTAVRVLLDVSTGSVHARAECFLARSARAPSGPTPTTCSTTCGG